MKIFVINLKRSPERRAFITNQLQEMNLDYEIFDAIDGRELTHEDILNNTKLINYAISRGEIGCALSHLGIYRKIVIGNIKQALILEDDALLHTDLPRVVEMLDNICLKEPTVTLLTEVDQYIHSQSHGTGDSNYSLHKVLEATCAHGYVINKEAAARLIDFLYPVWMVSDRWQILTEYSVCNVESVLPPVIEKSLHSASSTIQVAEVAEDIMLNRKQLIWSELKKDAPLR